MHLEYRPHRYHTLKVTLIHVLIPTFTTIPSIPGRCLGSELHRSTISDSASGYSCYGKRSEGAQNRAPGNTFHAQAKKGDRAGGGQNGRKRTRGQFHTGKGNSMCEHHRWAQMAVLGEVTQSSDWMVPLEVDRREWELCPGSCCNPSA